MTDGDGSVDYPRHARARNGDNGSTRHDPSPEGQPGVNQDAQSWLTVAKVRAAEKLRGAAEVRI